MKLKRARTEQVLNRVVIGVSWWTAGSGGVLRRCRHVYLLGRQIVLCLLLAALLLAVGSGVFSGVVMREAGPLSALVFNGDPAYTAFLVYWSYIILLSPAMPIALYITLVLPQWWAGPHAGLHILCCLVMYGHVVQPPPHFYLCWMFPLNQGTGPVQREPSGPRTRTRSI